jgi:hypothetical protein
MSKSIALVKGQSGILSLIMAIQAAGKVLDQDIQLAGMSVINHAEEHGDITLACALYLAMPKGARKAALAAWLMTFGKLSANTGLTKKEQPFVFDRSKTTDLNGAQQAPWFTFKLDKEPHAVFNLSESIAQLIKRAESAAKKGLVIEGAENLDALRNMIPKV